MRDMIIEFLMDQSIKNMEENGASLVLTENGAVTYTYNTGLSDVENKVPFNENTICRAYSCTKVVTAVACMLLMERGLLDPLHTLDRFFPEYANPYYIRDGKRLPSPPIRIRDLLNMTSGLSYPADPKDMNEGGEMTNEVWYKMDQSIQQHNSLTTQDFAKAMGSAALMFPAGQEWMYGSSADVLGAVIEKITDMELSDFYRINIFEPLGMEDTAFYVPSKKRDRLAVLYENAGEHPKKPDYVNLCIYDFDENPAFQSAGAGLFSTAADFAKLGASLSSDKHSLLSRHAIEYMRENGLSDTQKVTFNWESVLGYTYGNLVRTVENRNIAGTLASKGAFGWDGWTGTYLLCDPDEQLSITLFLQRCGAGTTQLSRNVVNAVYASL